MDGRENAFTSDAAACSSTSIDKIDNIAKFASYIIIIYMLARLLPSQVIRTESGEEIIDDTYR